MDIVAGGDVTVTGSEVISQDGIGISGQNVTIQAAENTTAITETQRFRQSGLNVSLSGGVVDTAMAVYNSAQRAGEVQDDRLAALHLAQAGQTLFSGGANSGMNNLKGAGDQFGDIGNAMDTKKGTGGSGMSLRIGIGASKSSSEQSYTATTASGSRIASEGDVSIMATGDGQGNGGDLSVIGSRIEGENVTLAAARDLLLQSQRETREQVERNQASSGEIGITIGSEAGIGVYVSASGARGKGDGSSTKHAETTVDAADTLTLVSGRDTTLEGAQARGETVIADIGRDLTLTSQQDTNDYARQDRSAGIDVAFGTGGGSVSGYANRSKIDSTYTSVREQTGIQAGSGGFDIRVGGHTELTGAAIASTADPSLNRISTGSLSATDLENRAEYEAESFGFSASGGSGGGSFTPSIGMPQSEEATSTTRSGISAGSIEVRDGDASALASLDRSVTQLQQDGLREIFDEQAVHERMEMGQVAGQVGFRVAGDIGKALTKEYTDAQMQAEAAQKLLDGASNDAERQLAQQMLDQANATMAANQGQYDLWKDGGTGKTLLHAVTGALVAAAGGGNALQGALGAGAAELGRPLTADESRLVQQLVSAGIGMVAGGGSGAATGLAGEQFNRQLHPEELEFIKDKAPEYAAEQGISVEEAEQQLLRGALMNNDDDWKELLTLYVSEGIEQYQEAFGWLAGKAGESNLQIRDSVGVIQPAFTSSAEERANEALFARQVLETPASLKMYLDSANITLSETSVGELMHAYLKNPEAETDAFLKGASDALKGYAAFVDPATYTGIASFVKQMATDPSGTTARIVKGLQDLGIDASAEVMIDILQMDLQDFRDGYAELRGGIAVEVVAELATMGTITAVTAAKYGLRGGKAVARVADAAEDVARVADDVAEGAVRRTDNVLGDVPEDLPKGGELANKDLVRGTKGDWNKLANNPEPNTRYTFDNGYAYQTDAQGRVASVEADLKIDPWDRNTYQQGKAASCGVEGDCGGHLIASLFGGPGEGVNLVPMDARLNGSGGAWYQMEQQWKRALQNGEKVTVRIEPQYIDNGKRPAAFVVKQTINGRPSSVVIPNG